jgi:hypothetical protein
MALNLFAGAGLVHAYRLVCQRYCIAAAGTCAKRQSKKPLVLYCCFIHLYCGSCCAAVQVLVAGDPRPAAQAKHADWVVARQPLQQLQQQTGVDEVILFDSSGALLEGLVSSFFVIADAAQMAALGQPLTAADVYSGSGSWQDYAMQNQQQPHEQQGGSKELTGLVLLTTGPAADTLLGITQQRVVQACLQLKLPVVLQPAKSCTAGAWREAFLSSW